MDIVIKFLTRVYISFSVAQHDVTHHPSYQPELLSSRTVSMYCEYECTFANRVALQYHTAQSQNMYIYFVSLNIHRTEGIFYLNVLGLNEIFMFYNIVY
jgi:hypothetical protein